MQWVEIRKLVLERDNGICQVCERKDSPEKLTAGHLIDVRMGGSDTLDNLMAMCRRCNRVKPYHETTEEALTWIENYRMSPDTPAFRRGMKLNGQRSTRTVLKTITLTPEVRNRLCDMKRGGQSYEELLIQMMDKLDEIKWRV